MNRPNRPTRICEVERGPDHKIKVTVNHGNTMKSTLNAFHLSPGRMRAQMKWVKRRLYESGDDSALNLGTYSTMMFRGQTRVTLSAENMELAT